MSESCFVLATRDVEMDWIEQSMLTYIQTSKEMTIVQRVLGHAEHSGFLRGGGWRQGNGRHGFWLVCIPNTYKKVTIGVGVAIILEKNGDSTNLG